MSHFCSIVEFSGVDLADFCCFPVAAAAVKCVNNNNNNDDENDDDENDDDDNGDIDSRNDKNGFERVAPL